MEDAGLFCNNGRSKPVHKCNMRVALDKHMIAAMAGSGATLRAFDQRAVLLAALPSRDRLRLLCMVRSDVRAPSPDKVQKRHNIVYNYHSRRCSIVPAKINILVSSPNLPP